MFDDSLPMHKKVIWRPWYDRRRKTNKAVKQIPLLILVFPWREDGKESTSGSLKLLEWTHRFGIAGKISLTLRHDRS